MEPDHRALRGEEGPHFGWDPAHAGFKEVMAEAVGGLQARNLPQSRGGDINVSRRLPDRTKAHMMLYLRWDLSHPAILGRRPAA